MSTRTECDLLVVGSGPAGMSAAINGASEGLRVCLIDGNEYLGGQARESNAIENYAGFPEGITGEDLMNRFASQATKFHTQIHCPMRAAKLHVEDDIKVITAEDYTQYRARTVLLSTGLSYRRLQADNIGQYMGRGVYYGLPNGSIKHNKKCRIVVIGGANSAGQAVLRMAQNKNAHITMLIRSAITNQMSKYLIDRIRELPNVDVQEGVSITHCEGNNTGLTHVGVSDGTKICTDSVHIFIGAMPRTMWLEGALALDDKKFIETWGDIRGEYHVQDGTRLPFETSIRGVFAAGDVRVGSVKRIASAIGEGATALQMIHQRLG